MGATARLVLAYLGLLFGKWMVWVFTILDVVGLVIILFLTGFDVPPIAFWLILAAGLVVANFLVYRDLIAKIPRDPRRSAACRTRNLSPDR